MKVDITSSSLIACICEGGAEIAIMDILLNLSKAYRCQVEVINVITAPEIEILIIASKKKYDEYRRSNFKKPSDYCKNVLEIKNVKSPIFIKDYFSNPSFLVDSIKEYHRVHKQKNAEATLYDLIKTK